MRAMHALYLVVPTLCILAIAYRYYSAFIAARVMVLDDARKTPAHTKYDGSNFYPTSRWVLFGHHFAAIAGSGPLIGPVLAAQFGWAPGFIWLLAGLGIVVVNALAESAWGLFTIGVTVPIGFFMGFYMFVWRKGQIKEATIIGVTLMFLGVIFGKNIANSSFAHYFLLSQHQIVLSLAIYGFVASTVPVWML